MKSLILLIACLPSAELNHYFADMHGHTSFSDGVGVPADAYKYARDVAKIDVFILTDHLEQLNMNEWSNTRKVADAYNQSGKFVAFAGVEWTTKGGHACIFEPTTLKYTRSTAALFQDVASKARGIPPILKICHPTDGGVKIFNNMIYGPWRDAVTCLVEVRYGQEPDAYQRMLELGWHVAPDGSTDSHKPYWGNRMPRHTWTCVLAPSLDRRSIWQAIRSRHCYSTWDKNCRLSFKINGAVMGDIITDPIDQINFELSIVDPDPHDSVASVHLVGEYTDTIQIPNAVGREVNVSRTIQINGARKLEETFFYLRVVQEDGDRIWSAPIWFRPK